VVSATVSGREIVGVLRSFGFGPVSRRGSHVRLRYEHPETGEVRTVDVPMHDEVKIGTLRSIADQCGAADVRDWCRWIDDHTRARSGSGPSSDTDVPRAGENGLFRSTRRESNSSPLS
jgi:predicted RNA binding protein YcfA (HicA-like mRNA interferase family)